MCLKKSLPRNKKSVLCLIHMVTLYTHQSKNITNSVLLMVLFTALVGVVVYVAAQAMGGGSMQSGSLFVIIFAISIITNAVAFWNSDKIALKASRATKADPKIHAQLHNIVENLAITAGLPKPQVYLIDDPAPNAFATGRNPKKGAVAVTTGLLTILNKAELEGVLAHELAHIGNRDTLVMTMTVILSGIIGMVGEWLWHSMYWFGGRGNSDQDSRQWMFWVVAIVGSIVANVIAMLLRFAISRKREFLADATGALITRYPEGLASALEKLQLHGTGLKHANEQTAHLFISNPLKKKSSIRSIFGKAFATHPSMDERIKRLREL